MLMLGGSINKIFFCYFSIFFLFKPRIYEFLFRSTNASLPDDRFEGVASVQYGSTLLLIGGNNITETVLEFDVANEAWIPRSKSLVTARSSFGAVLVDKSVVECNLCKTNYNCNMGTFQTLFFFPNCRTVNINPPTTYL